MTNTMSSYLSVIIPYATVNGLMLVIIPIISSNIIDRISSNNFTIPSVLILFTLILFEGIMNGSGILLYSIYCERFILELRNLMYSRMLNMKGEDIDQFDPNRLVVVLMQHVDTLGTIIFEKLPNMITSFIVLLGCLVWISLVSLKLLFLIIFISIIFILCILPMNNKMKDVSESLYEHISDLSEFLIRSLHSIDIIKVYDRNKRIDQAGSEIFKKIQSISVSEAKIYSILEPIKSIFSIILISICGIVSFYLFQSSEITIGQFLAFILIIIQSSSLIANLFSYQLIKQKLSIIGNNILLIIESKQEEVAITPNKDINFIQLNAVSYKIDNTLILDNISISFEKGKVYALVGSSGSGKTTLLKLLSGLLADYNGHININGDYHTQLLDIRPYLSYCPQNFDYIFSKVNKNIFLNERLQLQQIFLPVIKQKLNDKAATLSGGQLQQMNITRAFDHTSKLLILDEPFANLDIETEKLIWNTIFANKDNRITILSMHNYSELEHLDEIIFMEKGIITGIGSHSELYQQHTIYKHYINLQGKGEKV